VDRSVRQVQVKTAPASNVIPAYGRQNGLNPALQAFTANAGCTTLAPWTYYMVNVTNARGARNDAFYSKPSYRDYRSIYGSKGMCFGSQVDEGR
jgi:hypothetical protein